jgi:hypothetical protein
MPPVDPKKSDAVELSMTMVVDGVSYRFNLADISAKMELALYQQSGLILTKVVQEVAESPAGFHIAALVFLARLSRGDDVTFDEVADAMGLASEIELVLDDADADSDEDYPKVSDEN